MRRVRVFVRLLRRDAFEPAWTLATDNASGVVHATSAVSTWAGPGHARTQLALPTFVEDGAVFAWLPGFRDPRWAVPDEVFISARTSRCVAGSTAPVRRRAAHLAGSAWLTRLSARPEDTVELVLFDGADRIQIGAADADAGTGGGQRAGADPAGVGGVVGGLVLAPVAARSADWRVRIEVDQDGSGGARRWVSIAARSPSNP